MSFQEMVKLHRGAGVIEQQEGCLSFHGADPDLVPSTPYCPLSWTLPRHPLTRSLIPESLTQE